MEKSKLSIIWNLISDLHKLMPNIGTTEFLYEDTH
jgi:hypothetical protein